MLVARSKTQESLTVADSLPEAGYATNRMSGSDQQHPRIGP